MRVCVCVCWGGGGGGGQSTCNVSWLVHSGSGFCDLKKCQFYITVYILAQC